MQISSTPVKWTIPFAANDSAKVEIPATTTDATRFSLSLGSPPLTGQPPETGGVPPQLEDFNGAFNQIARFVWWYIGGGPLPYDATWSADPNVNGYANGALIPSSDGQGAWISTVDNNTTNPDTVGTGWVPGYVYGRTALVGQTGGTVTLTPLQAAKPALTVAGTLTSNLTIVVPAWIRDWTVTNTTTGAFTVTVKTAAGSGVLIPQNSAPTSVAGDGTNVTQLSRNIASATSPSQPPTMAQATGVVGVARNVLMNVVTAGASQALTANEVVVETALGGTRYLVANLNATINLATTGANGMDTGTAPASGFVAIYAIYNPATGVGALLATNANAKRTEVYNGANLPAGYTASALLGVVPTTASSTFAIGALVGRKWYSPGIQIYSATGAVTAYTALSGSVAIPANAVRASFTSTLANSSANGGVTLAMAGTVGGVGARTIGATSTVANAVTPLFVEDIPIFTAQTVYIGVTASAGAPTVTINMSSYEI